ncbi:VOC family protein [Pseudonocardia cypriaca]|nr:VOC family protein [Pseudonocardia cypriaca]
MTSFVFNVTFDCTDPRRVAAFWAGVTGYEVTEERPDFVRLRANDPRGVRHLLFFRVPEPKAGKNRVHVDLATRDPEAEIARLVALGATRDEHRSGNGTSWTVMRDPEGNEFCIG